MALSVSERGSFFLTFFFREQEEEEKKTSSPPRALPAHGEPRALSTTMTVGNVDRPPPGQGSLGASGEAAERREQVRFGRIGEKERERGEKSAARRCRSRKKKRGKTSLSSRLSLALTALNFETSNHS